jgi:predicted phosphodiesterase
MVRGNTDRYTTTLDRPAPTQADIAANPQLLAVYAEVAHTFAWTRGFLAATGWFEAIHSLPLETRLELPDGTCLLGVHAAPGMDDGQGLHPYIPDEKVLRLLDGCNADLICVGHTHWPMNRRTGSYHVVNVGSVSNPVTPDLQACYALLHADHNGYRVEHRRVGYDRAAVIAAIHAVHHPAGEYIVSMLQGKKIRHTWGEPEV